MSYNWTETKWGKISTIEYGKRLKGYKDNIGKYPVYGTNGQIGWTDSPLSYRAGVIIGRKGVYRGVHYSSKPFFVIDTAFYLKPNLDLVDPHWAYYKLLTQNINRMDSGSAIPSTSRHDFYNLAVLLPPLEVQKKHINILKSLDNKIDINTTINKNLEAIGQTLFKRWFIEFEFPDEEGKPYKSSGGELVKSDLGDIPKGWKVERLGDLTEKFTTGLNPRKNFVLGEGNNYYVTIKNMNNRRVILDERCDKVNDDAIKKINTRSKLEKDDILFSGIGTIGKTFYADENPKNWNISESIFVLRAKKEKITHIILYYLLLSYNFQNYSTQLASGSVQTGVRMADLKNYKVALPKIVMQKKISKVLRAILKQFKFNIRQIDTLSQIRDLLLPKLMSGKIRVKVPEV